MRAFLHQAPCFRTPVLAGVQFDGCTFERPVFEVVAVREYRVIALVQPFEILETA